MCCPRKHTAQALNDRFRACVSAVTPVTALNDSMDSTRPLAAAGVRHSYASAGSSTRRRSFEESALAAVHNILSTAPAKASTMPLAPAAPGVENTRYAALKDAFEELRHMRSTQAEADLSAAQKTWETRITAQQAVIEALRQENQTLRSELGQAQDRGSSGASLAAEHAALQAAHVEATKALAVLHARVTQLESELERAGAAAQAGSSGDSTAAAEHQLVKVFQHMTRMKIAPVEGEPATYTVSVLVSKHTKVTFTLRFSAGKGRDGSSSTSVRYTPGSGADRLPAFLHSAIDFDASQAPMFLAKVLEGAFNKQ